MSMALNSLLALVGLVAVHLFSGRLRSRTAPPRSIWLSLAGGLSVAYVFVHLLPELPEALEGGEGPAFLESHVYLVALVGLAVFYGLDRLAITSRRSKREGGKEGSTSPGVFWPHISTFAVYNFLIGYLLLHRVDTGPGNLLLFFVAMAMHFPANDHGLREYRKGAHVRAGRRVLAAAVALGWVAGLLTARSPRSPSPC